MTTNFTLPAFPTRALKILAAVLLLTASFAQGQNLTSAVTQSGANNDSSVPGVGSNGASGQNDPVPITGTSTTGLNGTVTNPAGNPWTFSPSQVAALQSINSISITLTIFDGDSGSNQALGGNFDFNNLTLGLGVPGVLTTAGGQLINTGIKLNGFDSAIVNGNDITLTLTGSVGNGTLTASTASALLALLKSPASGGQLGGLILDSTGAVDSNGMILSSGSSTTLTISGTAVPEPGTTALISLGLLCHFGFILRRKRS